MTARPFRLVQRKTRCGWANRSALAARYHDTITRFWVRLVAHAITSRPELQDFDAFLAAYPILLDPTLPFRHWRREAMFTPEARAEWREPDLLPLPF